MVKNIKNIGWISDVQIIKGKAIYGLPKKKKEGIMTKTLIGIIVSVMIGFILIVLKLLAVINWSWWIILAPIYILLLILAYFLIWS